MLFSGIRQQSDTSFYRPVAKGRANHRQSTYVYTIIYVEDTYIYASILREGTAVFKRLFRLLLTLVVVVVLIVFLAPRIFNGAANSLISSMNSSVAQAQGLAQFVPANVTSSNNAKGDLQVNLTGLTPSTTYQLTLDQGLCGGTSTSLGSATSDANGNFYIEIPMTSLDIKQTWYVDVLQQGQSVACGPLQTNQDASTQVVNASQAGPNVFGPQDTSPAQDTQNQNSAASSSPVTNSNVTNVSTSTGLPNTGVNPGNSQQYDNNQFPRKY